MKIPHRGGGSLQSEVPPPSSAPGKGSGFEFQRGACEGPAEIVLRMRVPTGETWTARAQNGRDLWSGGSVPQQFLGDPLIGKAPIRLREAFGNAQAVQPIGIDTSGWRTGQRNSGTPRTKLPRSRFRARVTLIRASYEWRVIRSEMTAGLRNHRCRAGFASC